MKPHRRSHTLFPWHTVLVAATTLGIAASAELTATLTCTRENWIQIWPLLTGHLCHWTSSHLLWDLAIFLVLSPLAERRLGRRYLPILVGTSTAIVASVFLFMPEIDTYRGLSGIDSFLYIFVALTLIQKAYPQSSVSRGLSFLPLLLFAGKSIFETITGQTLFSGSLGANVVALPLAHLTGAFVGLLVWLLFRRPAPENELVGS